MVHGEIIDGLEDIFDCLFIDATLHVPTQTDNGKGGVTVTHSNVAVRAQRDEVTEPMRQAPGYTDSDVMLIIQSNVPVTSDHELTYGGIRYAIHTPCLDATGSFYEARGQCA